MIISAGEMADKWADSQTFSTAVHFDEVRKVALPAGEAVVSGWYLLRFLDHTFYVGESVNLRARMSQHATKWGTEISTVRLLPQVASKQELKRRERILTRELEALGVPLRNVVNASMDGDRDALEELIPATAQRRWLADPHAFNAADATPLKAMAAQEIRYSTAARRYHEKTDAAVSTELLRTFLESCVPVPRATEFQYWSVSTGTFGGRRRLCVSVGSMEVFVLGENLSGFLNVRRSLLAPNPKAEYAFQRQHPRARLEHTEYRDADGDVIAVECPTPESMLGVLNDPQIVAAAARLILDIMRKHACIYTRNHCPQLVQSIYPGDRSNNVLPSGTSTETTVPGPPIAAPLFPDTVHPDMAVHDGSMPSADSDELGDIVCYWLVPPGPKKSRRNQPEDFLTRGEWRMDPHPRFEAKVADMLPGERIAVRTRRNTSGDDVPFDRRGNLVSVMDFHLTGTITANPGDGCSVSVAWDPAPAHPRQYYLYTSQDTVWTLARGMHWIWEDLIAFAFDGKPQRNLDDLRNNPFWSDRFGDR
ncbi:hypothetical protein ACFXHA_34600 [Nocardia sp. NPDC059240]|uniref:hypothetical protein n=1 Tax=Nocardia sp. NPDC059240 TaxID=3346786 RepID=UPI003679A99F